MDNYSSEKVPAILKVLQEGDEFLKYEQNSEDNSISKQKIWMWYNPNKRAIFWADPDTRLRAAEATKNKDATHPNSCEPDAESMSNNKMKIKTWVEIEASVNYPSLVISIVNITRLLFGENAKVFQNSTFPPGEQKNYAFPLFQSKKIAFNSSFPFDC
eukprot:TRINITY_DN4602_c0_g1_i1.p1 TRINITY_DN4602_c0_g1~~TRINITY_DN4602_c0_g1_i1.p1  ORF type:complete len:158 (-),score=17.96 TRINITY_DN4602_c0_g1_i1:157-630(-)